MRYRVLFPLLFMCPVAFAAEAPIDSQKTLTGAVAGIVKTGS